MRAGLRVFVLPLVGPLETAHGPIRARTGLLVTLEDEDGRLGHGEATPLPDFGGEDLDACRAALRSALALLVDAPLAVDAVEPLFGPVVERVAEPSPGRVDPSAPTRPHANLREALASACAGRPVARAALEAALASLAAERAGLPLARWIRRAAGLPGEPASTVACHALVAGARPEDVAAAARAASARGFTCFKLKLAVASAASPPARRDVAMDRERVAALREAIGMTGRIRLDANEAWSRAEAERALAQLAPFGIEFVEQPVARLDLEGLAALDRDGPIAVAADESLIEPGVEACLARRAAGIFVVKQAVLGGIAPTLALAARARAAGIRLVHSNLIEGCVGRATALALAAALADRAGSTPDRASEIHGLATADWLARDLEDVDAAWDRDEAFEADWLAWTADRHAAREALVFAGRRFSYGALARAARATGEALARAGIEEGDLVAVLASPSPQGVTLIHALLERRAVLLPIHARLAAPEIEQVLERTRPVALIVDETIDAEPAWRLAEAGGCALYSIAAESRPDLPPASAASTGEELVCAIERRHAAAGRVADEREVADRAAAGRDEAGAVGAAEARTDRSAVDPVVPRRASLRAIGAALVLMTSGTSGRAKAAVLTRGNLIASARASARLLGQDATDRWLLCMPLFHIGGLSILIRAALAGACVVVEPRFDARRVADALEAEGITQVSLVAATLAPLLDARRHRPRPPALRVALIGGGPAPESLLERARAAGIPIAPTYGLTEAASQVATRPPEARRASEPTREAGAGPSAAPATDPAAGLVPLPGVALRIVDEAGIPVATGEEGMIEVRGPIVMAGYLDDPESTARALRDGWLATGDVGRLDAAGRLRVLDRRGDLIVSGGENVYPAELEAVVAAHPDVVEAGVVGVPDARFGARPLAFVVWRPGVAPDPGAIAAWCRARLAGYKQPVDFVALAALPRNAAGKLLRRALAARADEAIAERGDRLRPGRASGHERET
ncbi:MAG: AMP-binding protein [Myxococcota bacterium]